MDGHDSPVKVDVAVVGGGIAGISVAGELCRRSGVRVAVLEQEEQLAYHSSGRSVAAFLESYGSAEIRALTQAARPLFAAAETETPLLRPRPLVWLAPEGHVEQLVALLEAEPLIREADEAEVRSLCPAVRPGFAKLAALEAGAQDIDVAALFELYRRRAVTGGATVHTRATVHQGEPGGARWVLHTDIGEVEAEIVVNAAGAWADRVAQRCGVAPVGLTALRRTVAIASCDGVDPAWPLVNDIAETFYFRPEGTGLLLSPADETPVAPCDARPEMEDVALALDRVNEATTLGLRHVRTSWAGLRTFAPDRNPVVGFDPAHAGFFWLAGQGGYGMQTAPAMAALAASLIRGDTVDLVGFDPNRLSPARFRT